MKFVWIVVVILFIGTDATKRYQKNICSLACSKTLKPVCAINHYGERAIFPSMCHMEKAMKCNPSFDGFLFKHAIDCFRPMTEYFSYVRQQEFWDCNSYCKGDYDPVCGRTLQGTQMSFYNRCNLEKSVKCTPEFEKFFYAHEGLCVEKGKK